MRWLSPAGRRDERGAVAMLAAFFAVVMVVVAALVVDIGALHDERRQLQNGADAAALAVAHSCALGECGNAAVNNDLAQQMANGNALDGEAELREPVLIDLVNKRVTVKVRTRSADGDTILPYFFAKAFTGEDGKTVNAEATASWSRIVAAAAVPLAVSQCDLEEFRKLTGDSVMYFAKSEICGGFSKDAPGAFGWLDGTCPTEGTPQPTAEIGTMSAKTGKPPMEKGCLEDVIGDVILLPVFSHVTCAVKTKGKSECGTNATYTIVGFAALQLTGYHFTSDDWPVSSPPCRGAQSCISGRFIDYVTGGSPGTGTGFGAMTVHLVK